VAIASKYPGVTAMTDGTTTASRLAVRLLSAATVAGLAFPLNATFDVIPAASTPGMARTASRKRLTSVSTAGASG
jgi:hypothetical protein